MTIPYLPVSRADTAKRLGLSVKVVRLAESAALAKIAARLVLLDREDRSDAIRALAELLARADG